MKKFIPIFIMLISVQCVQKQNNDSKESIVEEIKAESLLIVDTMAANSCIRELRKFRLEVEEMKIINDESFSLFLEQRRTPFGFVQCNIYDQEKLEELVMIIFLKMFYKGISPSENNITYRSQTNPYLIFMIYKYYELSKKDPAGMILLSDVVKWIIYESEYQELEIVNDEKQRLMKEFNLIDN